MIIIRIEVHNDNYMYMYTQYIVMYICESVLKVLSSMYVAIVGGCSLSCRGMENQEYHTMTTFSKCVCTEIHNHDATLCNEHKPLRHTTPGLTGMLDSKHCQHDTHTISSSYLAVWYDVPAAIKLVATGGPCSVPSVVGERLVVASSNTHNRVVDINPAFNWVVVHTLQRCIQISFTQLHSWVSSECLTALLGCFSISLLVQL